MCGTLGPLHERSRTAKGGRRDEKAKDVKMGKALSCEEILLSNAKVWASRETQLLNKTALACNLMVSLWCVIVLGGWVGGGVRTAAGLRFETDSVRTEVRRLQNQHIVRKLCPSQMLSPFLRAWAGRLLSSQELGSGADHKRLTQVYIISFSFQ